MAVKFGGAKDYSAMQGPCNSGFHIPTSDEWEALYDAFTGLGLSSSADWQTYFKMPYAGYRKRSDASVESQGYWGYYWASSVYTNVANSADCLRFNSSNLYPSAGLERSIGESIRPFKDVPVPAVGGEIILPGWTRLYGNTMTGNVIAWNSTEGLISICSDDGNTWITIADKNLGATTVYNSGDTLSEANCGKYYQRGNNYGFAWIGTLTTSSTQVNATNYGPGNYYSSSTFITRSGTPYGWDSSNNKDLRGGVTGIRPGDLQAAYIGEVTGWRPSTSTLLYLPLEENLNDTYNSITPSASSGITFTTQDGVKCAYSNDNYAIYLLDMPNDHTSCCRLKTNFDNNWMVYWCEDNILDPIPGVSNSGYTFQPTLNASGTYYFYDRSADYATTTTYTAGWTLVTLTKSGTTVKMYKNDTLIGTWTVAQNFAEKRLQLFTRDISSQRFKGYASNLIVENKVWTDQEISNYYNQTKGTYGL